MRIKLLAATVGCTALLASGAQAKRLDVEPSSSWNVDFGIEKCRLARYFGEGEDRHIVLFDQYWPSESFGLTVGGPGFDRFQSRKRTSLSFSQEKEPMRTEPFAGTVDGVGGAVIYSRVHLETGTDMREEENTRLPQLDTALGAKVAHVHLKQGGRDVLLKTGALDEAFEVLNSCTQQLVRDWGLDPAKHLTAQRLVRWTNEKEVTRRIQNDYPRSALFAGEQGIVRMRVMVSEEGAVTDCSIVNATTVESLESPACKEMKRARFDPALDKVGKPFASYFVSSIVYQIGR